MNIVNYNPKNYKEFTSLTTKKNTTYYLKRLKDLFDRENRLILKY